MERWYMDKLIAAFKKHFSDIKILEDDKLFIGIDKGDGPDPETNLEYRTSAITYYPEDGRPSAVLYIRTNNIHDSYLIDTIVVEADTEEDLVRKIRDRVSDNSTTDPTPTESEPVMFKDFLDSTRYLSGKSTLSRDRFQSNDTVEALVLDTEGYPTVTQTTLSDLVRGSGYVKDSIGQRVLVTSGKYEGLSGVIQDETYRTNGAHIYLVRVELPNDEIKVVTLRASRCKVIDVVPRGTQITATYQITEDTVSVTAFTSESDMSDSEIKEEILRRVNLASLPKAHLTRKTYQHWTSGVAYLLVPDNTGAEECFRNDND
ncbi:hypothetical protein LIS04_178 [Listeria phage LIS04]|nr:hypothetical protein LIS04_178 [Listeria phage LIS04]